MSPKPGALRASAEVSPPTSPVISTWSDNVCSIGFPNRIREGGLEDFSATERTTITARFWSKVKKSDGCWLWTGYATGSGGVQHGALTLRSRHFYTHRLSWELAYGAIPKGLNVCHRCDVGRCVRPEHLFLGTQNDNIQDAAQKGRFHRPRTRRLTPEDRLAIFAMPERRGLGMELAVRYGVSRVCISHIRRGRFLRPTLQTVAPLTQHGQLIGHLHQQRSDARV